MRSSSSATRWQVITGAPCSGKTTLIQALAGRGHRVVPETARAYIDQCLAQGLTLPQIKADPLGFEQRILIAKVALETALPRDRLIFMDRAVPDSVAYYRFEGLDPAEPLRHSRTVRYETIFLLERLAFEQDTVRSEDAEGAARLEAMLTECYELLGYAVVRVPVMGIDQRADFILQHLYRKGAHL
ncbi:MAG: ATP-binding protein [Desulfobacterales bacterium]|nr:ATP-binding protein [Desulfobacterales bacterium]MBI5896122.1 ATP-binding protein [Desulfobacterales bacterium]